VGARRAVLAPIPTTEMNRERWIATESFPLYRAAFAVEPALDATDRRIIRSLTKGGPKPLSDVSTTAEERIQKLVNAYLMVRVISGGRAAYVAAEAWVPRKILGQEMGREEARRALVEKFMKCHGPVTKYEVMERYGFSDQFVEGALEALRAQGKIARGEYVPTKSFPQWCYRSSLEEIHRLTLNRLRKEMEPATPAEYADFLLRWQHVHPGTRLAGIDGLREAIRQLQGHENYQALFERDVFPRRVSDYDPSLLDRLCYSGEVCWRRFGHGSFKRGQIGFCLREDRDWLVTDPREAQDAGLREDEDIRDVLDAVREFLAQAGACFFDDICDGTGRDRRHVLRAVWHLVWTGEATTDSYESIRHANVTSGLSACYDLSTELGDKPIDHDGIAKRMLEHRRLDPTLGRWAPTERLAPADLGPPKPEERAGAWARLLLSRWGIVCRDTLKREVGAPPWRDLRRALAKLELLGQVRRGFFVQELAGEQYARPEAVDALRDAKLRHPPANGDDAAEHEAARAAAASEPMILLNSCEPANPFSRLLPLVDEAGEKVTFPRNPHNYVVLQGGQPVLLYQQGRITLMADLTKGRAEQAVRALMQLVDNPPNVTGYSDIRIRDWNGHPSDVSPARHLLAKLGFVRVASREKGFVYDGTRRPDGETIRRAEEEMPPVFERAGKERAPVKYDAQWIISRSSRRIQRTTRALLELLERILPREYDLAYHPRHFTIRYRGVGCAQSDIGHKQIRLRLFHQGFTAWLQGILMHPGTDVNAAAFAFALLERLEESRRAIDDQLSRGAGNRRPRMAGDPS